MDSPINRRIVRSFLDFLNSVESTSDDDIESLKLARHHLTMVFGLVLPSTDEEVPQGLLLDLFQAGTSSHPVDLDGSVSVKDSDVSGGKSKEELLGSLYDVFYFKTYAKGKPRQVAKAGQLYDKALKDCLDQKMSSYELAVFFNSKGILAWHSELYTQAVKLYTEAISLCNENPVSYCNRAAAYTKLNKYLKAVEDCLNAIAIDPKHCNAYRWLGNAYCSLGKYHDALDKGYLRALELDPNDSNIQEKIKVIRSKLDQEESEEPID